MKYNGQELIEMIPTNWDGKTRKMLVWTDVSNPVHYGNLCHIKTVIGYSTEKLAWVVSDKRLDYWPHCAEIPDEEKVETIKELSLKTKELRKEIKELKKKKLKI